MPSPSDPPISMYVPARNAERTLAACIDAIKAQTRPPDELFIVVDPRSTDRTTEIAAATGVRIVRQQGSTLGAARNEAIAAARHPWLACCDSDVTIEPDWLERLAGRRDQGAVGIGGRTNENVRNPFDAWRALHMPHHWGDYPLRNPFMLVSEVLFERRALLAVGGYQDDLNYYEDSDLCQRLRNAGYDLLYEPSAVATHQRTDTLLGVLTLRWKYSAHRQWHLMDSFAGLVAKCSVNREYALTTLSRSIARRREELAYISFLLFFHHLLMDLRSLLSRRPPTSTSARVHDEHQLIERAIAAIAERHADLGRQVLDDLNTLAPPAPPETISADAPPAWQAYLDEVRTKTGSFCSELPAECWAIVYSSARHVHGEVAAERVQRLPAAAPGALQAAVEALPVQPFVDDAFCQGIRQHWPDACGVRLIGPLTDDEQAAVNRAGWSGGCHDANIVALSAHLEARPDPVAVFGEIDARALRLVVCYQPPARFVPGLDVPSASDLASSAAAAGWTIERFDTLVGRTRLMLSRTAETGAAAR